MMKWMYGDGTVFYLSRDATEAEDASRRALGPRVWRRHDGKDALFEDCIGPSSYQKAQGKALRVWGFLVEGKFKLEMLPEGQVMNQE